MRTITSEVGVRPPTITSILDDSGKSTYWAEREALLPKELSPDDIDQCAAEIAQVWRHNRKGKPLAIPCVLNFIDEDGAGNHIHKPRPPNGNDRQTAKELPIDVEFRDGRINPVLREFSRLFARVYELANAPYHAAPSYCFLDNAENPVLDPDDDGDAEAVAVAISRGPINWESDAAHSECASRTGANLIVALMSGVPVNNVYRDPDPAIPTGVEVQANATDVCKLLQYRMSRLYIPVRDAVVLGRSMKQIGLGYGGNSADAAKLGREKVIDGLWFAKTVLDDLLRWESEDEHSPAREIIAGRPYALGRAAADLPRHWHIAANDDKRRIADVA